MSSPTENFAAPSNLEHSKSKIKKNKLDFSKLESTILRRSRDSTFIKRELMGKAPDRKKIYDDDLTETISEVFNDRTRTIPILGDIIRALHLSIRRKDITFEEFLKMSIDKIEGRVTRFDIAQLTKIDTIRLNSMSIFMNGGPTGEYWNTANNGFYDWIDNKSSESIFGVELGFKADDYGLEVCSKLIEKKRKNPNINISLLIDGFVSYLMNKPGSSREEFENKTISMVNNMRREKINVLVNDS